MKIAFLGGTRFIGLRAVELAREKGHELAVLHRGKHNATLPSGAQEITVNPDDISSALKQFNPDVLIDCFAMTGAQTSRTLAALKGHVRKVVVLSSQDVYAQFGSLNGHKAPPPEFLVSEGSPLTVPFPFRGGKHEGDDEYDKKDVESLYKRAVPDILTATTVLRLPAVYGQRDYQRRLCAVVDKLDSGLPALPCQNQANWRWTHGHVTNMAHAILLAAERSLDGYHVYNVGEAATPTMRERVEMIAKVIGRTVEWEETENLPDDLSILGKMPNNFIASSAKLRAELGYKEILEEEACYRDLVAWARECRK